MSMPVDTGIYGSALQPPKSLIGYSNDLDQAQLGQTQLASAKLNLIGQQQSQADTQALRTLYQQPDFNINSPGGLRQAMAASPSTALQLQKAALDNASTQSTIGKNNADADKAVADAANLRLQHAIQVQGQLAQAAGAATDQPSWDRGLQIAQALGVDTSSIPKVFDPATAKSIATQAMTGQQQLEAHQKAIDQAETARHNTADEGLQARGQNMTASNEAANRQNQLTIAGVQPNGTLAPNMETMAQGIAKGEIAPLSGFALARPGGQALMGRVMAINPDYDATTYGAKAAAARAFTSGQQGNALRSVATANDHLDQLDKLGDALNNGQIPAINAIGNAFGVQTGQPPAQVFNAVKNIVAQEVVKAIVAGGGTGGERDEAAKAFATSSSPQQLKQTIAQYRAVMGAQKQNLLEQRRAAGLPDSTIPNYQGQGGTLPSADDIAAELARRGH